MGNDTAQLDYEQVARLAELLTAQYSAAKPATTSLLPGVLLGWVLALAIWALYKLREARFAKRKALADLHQRLDEELLREALGEVSRLKGSVAEQRRPGRRCGKGTPAAAPAPPCFSARSRCKVEGDPRITRMAAPAPRGTPLLLPQELPSWVRNPDVTPAAQLQWLNSVSAALWPHVEKAGCKWARENLGACRAGPLVMPCSNS